MIYGLVVFTAIYFLMFYQQRYLLSRVDLGLFLAISLFLCWLLSADHDGQAGSGASAISADGGTAAPCHSTYVLLIAFMVVTMALQQWHGGWRSQNEDLLERRLKNLNLLHMISADKAHLYIGKTGIIGPYICYGPFEARPVSELDNRGFYGGWACNTPVILANMKRYGVTNPYRDCVDNDAVYILDSDIKSTIQYIRTYYNADAEYKEVKRLGSYGVYSIYTKGAQ